MVDQFVRFSKDLFGFQKTGRFQRICSVFKGLVVFKGSGFSFTLSAQQYKDANAFAFTIAYSIARMKPSIFGIKRAINDCEDGCI